MVPGRNVEPRFVEPIAVCRRATHPSRPDCREGGAPSLDLGPTPSDVARSERAGLRAAEGRGASRGVSSAPFTARVRALGTLAVVPGEPRQSLGKQFGQPRLRPPSRS